MSAYEIRMDGPAAFDPSYYEAYRWATHLTAGLVYDLLEESGLSLAGPITPAELTTQQGWPTSSELLVTWAMELLVEAGWATQDELSYTITTPRPTLGAPASAFMVDPGLPLLQRAARLWPNLLREGGDGLLALFSNGGLEEWERYFHPEHPLYHVHNTWGGEVVVERLQPNGVLLELGAGYGSAALGIATRPGFAARMPRRYLLTDINRRMAKRAAGALGEAAPGLQVEAGTADFNQELTTQGLPVGEIDLIYACNALHCANDLVESLTSVRRLLRPGGRLILSESARGSWTEARHQELIFLSLDSYRHVGLNAQRRRPGFLTPEGWGEALAAAGYTDLLIRTNQSNPADPVLGVVVEGVNP